VFTDFLILKHLTYLCYSKALIKAGGTLCGIKSRKGKNLQRLACDQTEAMPFFGHGEAVVTNVMGSSREVKMEEMDQERYIVYIVALPTKDVANATNSLD
jgi:hypothetical protein